MERYQEVMVAFSESVMKLLPEAPPGREITMTLYPPCNDTSLSRKPCIADKKLIWSSIRESWSLFQNPSYKIAWSAPWRRNHDDVISGLQKKPRYLGNQGSQIKSYHWSLSGSHDRSFRIRHEKSREAPRGEEWRLRHIRSTIQPRYLGNNAC